MKTLIPCIDTRMIMLAGFTVANVSDLPQEALTDKIVRWTLKAGTPEDPSVIHRYQMAPGASAGEDPHFEVEHLLIEAGLFNDGERLWPAGSVISGAPGSVHYPSSAEGCTFLAFHPNGLGEPTS
ncbi:hypothetical protein [Streptomyces sp. NPDC058247]|uniref:hypothetical protein n=1 Tax=Streptomyces sp. NPDC058247 TaxID=3346401 RepID=UPI0036EF2AE9